MSDFDYIAWSLLLAGAFALLLAIIGRFTGNERRPPLERRRERLELELGNQLTLRHSAEAGNIQDTIARLEAFAARHPALGPILAVIDRVYLTVGIFGMGFVTVALWAGKLGTGGGKWSPFALLVPYSVLGALIESIPPYGVQWRGALVMIGLLAAFTVPLAVISWWVP
jgi:hypothetical protein